MNRGFFEEGKSLPIIGIFSINFAYDPNIEVSPTLSSYISELSEITSDILKCFRGMTNAEC